MSVVMSSNQIKLETCEYRWAMCEQCGLHRRRKRVVFGAGPSDSPLVIIGEAPGDAEDENGRPFTGRAGTWMYQTAAKAGMALELAYTTNLVGCRPLDKREPLYNEVDACRPRWWSILAVLEPKVVLILGSKALLSITGKDGIQRWRGKTVTAKWNWKGVERTTPAVGTYHPSGLIKSSEEVDTLKRIDQFVADLGTVWDIAGLPKS